MSIIPSGLWSGVYGLVWSGVYGLVWSGLVFMVWSGLVFMVWSGLVFMVWSGLVFMVWSGLVFMVWSGVYGTELLLGRTPHFVCCSPWFFTLTRAFAVHSLHYASQFCYPMS